MKEIALPSGKILKITLSSFYTSKELYKSFLEEMKKVKLESTTEIDVDLFKNIACELLASPKFEKALWDCMKRVTIDGIKVTEDTFEDEEARGDYLSVVIEVSKANIMPFMKNLSAQFSHIMGEMNNAHV